MFTLIKFLLSAALLVLLGVVILYFLPASIKIDGAQALVNFVPETVKEKAEALILTPPEQRAKLIAELEDKLTYLKENPGADDTDAVLQEIENLLNELKDKSDETSLTETIKSELVDQLLSKGEELLEGEGAMSTLDEAPESCDCELETE